MKILVVDDHHLIREGMRPVLRQLASGAEAVEVLDAATFGEARAHLQRHADVELVLLDLRLPDASGLDALDELQRTRPDVPVVLMSGEDDAASVRAALERGALGYIPKSSSAPVVLNALRLVLAGGVYVPPEILQGDRAPAAQAPRSRRVDPARLGLTPRQMDVLALLVGGKSNKEICRELDLSEGTVKAHLAAIFKALGVANRVQAVIEAGKLGLKA